MTNVMTGGDPTAASMPVPAIHVAVLGPGGVGGLLGALLATAGAQVTCLAGAATAGALNAHGLHVSSTRFGDFSATVTAAERLDVPVNVCLVTVKATDLDTALDRVPAQTLGDALVVSLLNGVEHVALLRERYPDALVLAATIRVESSRTAPGQIVHSSPFANVDLAATPESLAAATRFATHLRAARLDVTVGGTEVDVLWRKLSFLAPMALLTTWAQAPIGDIRQREPDRLRGVVTEVCAVARAAGASVADDAVLAQLMSVPAGMRSSMQRDAEAGRRIELDAIGGAVLRSAQEHGIRVPVTAELIAELQQRGLSS
jgi:2-dehydropantoate 2-reductase